MIQTYVILSGAPSLACLQARDQKFTQSTLTNNGIDCRGPIYQFIFVSPPPRRTFQAACTSRSCPHLPVAIATMSSLRRTSLLLLLLAAVAAFASAAAGDGAFDDDAAEDFMSGVGDDAGDMPMPDADAGMPADGDGEEEKKPDVAAVIDPAGVDGSYDAPAASGAAFLENFQDGLGRWTHARGSSGRFQVGQGAKPTFAGDRGLIIPQKARVYVLSAEVDGLGDLDGEDFVVQYEIKLEEGMTCGGAYVKLPTDGFPGGEAFDNTVKYSVMFGPDKCGSKSKVHVILQSVLGEHHLTSPPDLASTYDKKTHLYGLVVRKDGTVEVSIDGEVKKTAKLSEDFEPPFQPVEEIDDADDKKPEDWVEVKQIPDQEAEHPPKEEWDDAAPKEIPDMEQEMPDGWKEDEPLQVRDPAAAKPEEWDEEDDGSWDAPMIPNPKCEETGCGKWIRPTKVNPEYKGKWKAPMVDNPAYIGEWKPKKIPNPEYFKLEKEVLLPVRAVGLELWTMDQGVVFDNLWLGKDVEAAAAYAALTFEKKKVTEEEDEKKEKEAAEKKAEEEAKSPSAQAQKALGKLDGLLNALEMGLQPIESWIAAIGAEPVLDKMIDAGVAKPLLVVVSVPLVLVMMMVVLLSSSGSKKPADKAAEKKKNDSSTADDESTADAPTADVSDDVQPAGDTAAEPTLRRRRGTATAE